ncbi:MAG: ECF transporter S component [Bacillota bacterium]|nr:ECF transporter S component [Bacillota bacterium]
MERKLSDVKYLTLLGLFVAIELVLGLVPNLGYIQLPVLALTIITAHVPVIISGVILGPKAGGILGFFFGLTSMINATYRPSNPIEGAVFSPFFTAGPFTGGVRSVIICFLPRILVGVFAGLLFAALKKARVKEPVSLILSGVAGSLTNTILVLAGIYFIFGNEYAAGYGMTMGVLRAAIFTVISTNGLTEAVLAAIVTLVLGKALLKVTSRY